MIDYITSKLVIVAYFLIQFIATGLLLAIEMQKSWLICHLSFTVITSILYIIVHLKNPGYLKISLDSQQKKQQQEQQPPLTENRIQKQEKQENLPKEVQPQGPLQSNIPLQAKVQCRLCQIDQPMRTKHCYQCQRCVPTFDHHCPWMATCIGEKNRGLFVLYLAFQVLEILLAAIYTTNYSLSGYAFKQDFVVIILGLFLLFGALSGLLGFHIYLMFTNVTTWQFLKEKEIPYLDQNKRIEKAKGNPHPFSKGWKNNFIEYWTVTFSSERKNWEMQAKITAKKRVKQQQPNKQQENQQNHQNQAQAQAQVQAQS